MKQNIMTVTANIIITTIVAIVIKLSHRSRGCLYMMYTRSSQPIFHQGPHELPLLSGV